MGWPERTVYEASIGSPVNMGDLDPVPTVSGPLKLLVRQALYQLS
jgi:hypothetical protein